MAGGGFVGSSMHGCWLGTYEHENQSLFVALVPANGTVYDIGANVGFYTSLLRAEPNARLLLSSLPRTAPISSGTWT